MITEILDSRQEPADGGTASIRYRRRRRAVAAVGPLVLGGAAVGAVAITAPDHPGAVTDASPAVSPTATPCSTPRVEPVASTPQTVAPTVLLANHQPCNHHEGMVTAFRWV
jgi:hypothetical protein